MIKRFHVAVLLVVSVLLIVLASTAISQTSPDAGKGSPVAQPKKSAPAQKRSPASPATRKVEALTNASVVKMVEAGLDEQIIVTSIKSAQKPAFQVDADSLIDLKMKKVPTSVIRAMMEKSGMAVAGVPATEPLGATREPTAAKATASSTLAGTWAGQMAVENEQSAIRLVFQKGALGTYSGAIALQGSSGIATSGKVDVREQGSGIVLSAFVEAGSQVEFTPNSLSAAAVSGDAQIRIAGSNGIRKGSFSIVKESEKEDTAELFRFQNSLGKIVVRQGDSWQVTVAPRPQQHAFSNSKAADAKDAAKDVALAQAGMTMTANLASKIATSVPLGGYFAMPVAVVTMLPFLRKNVEVHGFEYEFLRESKAVAELKAGTAEFVVPLNQYIPSDANITDLQPAIVQLDVMGSDSVRVLTVRKVLMKQKKQGKFDKGPTMERTELSVDQKTVPTDIEKGPNNSFVLRPKNPLAAGEYALAVYAKSGSGGYTESVPLKAQWTADDMVRFMKKGEEWTGYGALAWDFRVAK